jgi:hypothetical protein
VGRVANFQSLRTELEGLVGNWQRKVGIVQLKEPPTNGGWALPNLPSHKPHHANCLNDLGHLAYGNYPYKANISCIKSYVKFRGIFANFTQLNSQLAETRAMSTN